MRDRRGMKRCMGIVCDIQDISNGTLGVMGNAGNDKV